MLQNKHNMKNLFAALLLLPMVSQVCAQDKIAEIPMKPKHKYLQGAVTENGVGYFVTGNDKASKTEVSIIGFDSNLNQKLNKDMLSKYEGLNAIFGRGVSTPEIRYNMWLTEAGKYVFLRTDELLMDDTGKTVAWSDDLPDFETSFSLYADDFKLSFGYKTNKKKKIDKEAGTFFYRTALSDETKKLIPLVFPSFESLIKDNEGTKKTKDKNESWGKSFFDDKHFFMINKELSKDWTENQYNIVGFDYEGNPEIKLSIPLKLKDKYFTLSDTGFGGSRIVTSQMAGAALMDDDATGNIYVDNGFIYIYGLYANEKNGNMNKANYDGFYIYKFDEKGQLVWKTEEAIAKSDFNKVQRPLAVNVHINMLKGNQIGFRIDNYYSQYAHFFTLSSEDGKILRSQKPEFDREGNRYEGSKGGMLYTGYALEKIYVKKHIDLRTLYAAFLSEKVDSFLKSNKTELNYNATISRDAIYLIEENDDTKGCRLLRFDL